MSMTTCLVERLLHHCDPLVFEGESLIMSDSLMRQGPESPAMALEIPATDRLITSGRISVTLSLYRGRQARSGGRVRLIPACPEAASLLSGSPPQAPPTRRDDDGKCLSGSWSDLSLVPTGPAPPVCMALRPFARCRCPVASLPRSARPAAGGGALPRRPRRLPRQR